MAALTDGGPNGAWASIALGTGVLAAPEILGAEVTSALRRAERAGLVDQLAATLALRDLLDLPVRPFPFEPFALRVWDLRMNFTVYDAWYVALAEALDAPLVTLDERMARAVAQHTEVDLRVCSATNPR
jgi:predicted nucleic acid-binding protein